MRLTILLLVQASQVFNNHFIALRILTLGKPANTGPVHISLAAVNQMQQGLEPKVELKWQASELEA